MHTPLPDDWRRTWRRQQQPQHQRFTRGLERQRRRRRPGHPISARRHLAWFVGGIAVSFLVPFVVADQIELQRDLYYAVYVAAVVGSSWRGPATPASRCARCSRGGGG
jgi:hypothetical protein